MTHAIVNPTKLHDPTGFGYSHIVATDAPQTVYIAGQYASDDTGQVVSDDFEVQVERAFDNLGIALEAAGLDYSHVVRLGTHVVDHDIERLAIIGRLVRKFWGGRPPAQTLSGVHRLALPQMLFEVDAIAVSR